MKYFMFLIEFIILCVMTYFNIKTFKQAVREGDEDKVWKWVILLLTFALAYFFLNATWQAITED